MQQQYLLSIDIEGEGDDFQNPIIAIGSCFGPADGSWPREKLIRFRGNLAPLPGQVLEKRCYDEFWSKNLDVYNEIKKAQRPAEEVMEKFLSHVQQLVAIYEDGEINGKIKIVTDCPDYDLGRLHVLGRIQTQTWPGPIRHLGSPQRHNQVDPGERLDALNLRDECDKWINAKFHGVVLHDHRPERDAEHSYYQMIFLHLFKTGGLSLKK